MWSQLRFIIYIKIILTYSWFELNSKTVWISANTDLDTTDPTILISQLYITPRKSFFSTNVHAYFIS